MRDFNSVVADVLGNIPDSHARLRERLEDLKRRAGFCAPENMAVYWKKLCDALEDELGPDMTDADRFRPWMLTVAEIVNAEGFDV